MGLDTPLYNRPITRTGIYPHYLLGFADSAFSRSSLLFVCSWLSALDKINNLTRLVTSHLTYV